MLRAWASYRLSQTSPGQRTGLQQEDTSKDNQGQGADKKGQYQDKQGQ